jgi:hypothetical protein
MRASILGPKTLGHAPFFQRHASTPLAIVRAVRQGDFGTAATAHSVLLSGETLVTRCASSRIETRVRYWQSHHSGTVQVNNYAMVVLPPGTYNHNVVPGFAIVYQAEPTGYLCGSTSLAQRPMWAYVELR